MKLYTVIWKWSTSSNGGWDLCGASIDDTHRYRQLLQERDEAELTLHNIRASVYGIDTEILELGDVIYEDAE